MNPVNILVFPYGTEIANEIINALKHNKYFKLIYATSDELSKNSLSRDKISLLPYVNHPVFLEKLNSLTFEQNIAYIIPAHDDVALMLANLEDKITAEVIGQSKAINNIVRFKDKTYDQLKGIVLIPPIYVNNSTNTFPIFVKPKVGQGSLNAQRINSKNEFKLFFDTKNINDFLIMDNLPGPEYTIDCFSDQGSLMYCGARTRDKTLKGISVSSELVSDQSLIDNIEQLAKGISSKLNLHGLWFFQLIQDKQGRLNLLEVSPRVSGTMMVNRVRGVNFVELAIFQKMGKPIEVLFNDIKVSITKTLKSHYQHNIEYQNLYVDFDDTLCIDEKNINTDIIQAIFSAKNKNKNIYLITKNSKNNLTSFLHRFGITSAFDQIIHLHQNQEKVDYMKENSILIDDSFTERKKAIKHGLVALGVDAVEILLP